MTEQAVIQQQILESDFAAALDCIESPDPESRRLGAARLEKIGGNRSYQVASVLVGDADPVVASIARRICATQRKTGMIWRGLQSAVRPAERQILTDAWQILDEVAFIARRNMSELASVSLIAALPKLLLVFAIFAGPYLFENFSEYVTVSILIFALGLHQVLWRPLVWLAIGKAFLGGFPDRMTRQHARSINIWQAYLLMFAGNIVPALVFTLVLGLTYYSLYSRVDAGTIAAAWLGFWVLIWEPSFYVNPTILSRPTPAAVGEGIIFRAKSKFSIVRPNLFFIIVLGIFYLMLYSSAVAGCAFLGMSLQPTGLKIPQELWYVALLIGADCLLDPFVIGYRVLINKLMVGATDQ